MRTPRLGLALALLAGLSTAATAQQATSPPVPGKPLPKRENVKTFGSFLGAESVSYDAANDRYVVVSTGVNATVRPNDGYVSLLEPDGTVHTLKWLQTSAEAGVTLDDPRGSDIQNGVLYVADRDRVRLFDMGSGAVKGEHRVEGAIVLNDLEVTADGTVYVTDTGNDDPATSAVYKIGAAGEITKFATGGKLARPNGIAFDAKGNIVVVLIATADVLTYAPSGELLATTTSSDPGNDGLVILDDGTMYVSSVRQGTVAKLVPGKPAERIATDIPNAASMMLDTKRDRLVIPQNQQNAVTFVDLGG